MELQGKAVKVADVERAKIVVEGIVQKSVVDGEVVWLLTLRDLVDCSLRALPRRPWFGIRVGKQGMLGRRFRVGCKVQSVCEG